jgi:hypothetical protein
VKRAKQIEKQRRNNPRIGTRVKEDKHVSRHCVSLGTTNTTTAPQTTLQILLEFRASVESFDFITGPPGDRPMNKLEQPAQPSTKKIEAVSQRNSSLAAQPHP